MTRLRLRNKLVKRKYGEFKHAYNKQRNLWYEMIRKVKKDCYGDLNVRNITDNKQF